MVALPSSVAHAGDLEEFETAKNRWDSGNFADALGRFDRMLDPALEPCGGSAVLSDNGCRLTDATLIESARAYRAATLVELDRGAEARAEIRELYLKNPKYQLSPNFSVKVSDVFVEVRGEVDDILIQKQKEEAERQRRERLEEERRRKQYLAYVGALESAASVESVTEERSRWVALVPFGVGQFQNGSDGLGWFFLGSQALAGATSLVAGVIVMDLAAEGRATPDRDTEALNQEIDAATAVNRIAFLVWAVSTVGGIAQAQAAFEPGRTSTRKRPLPPKPPTPSGLEPKVSIGDGVGTVGVGGRF